LESSAYSSKGARSPRVGPFTVALFDESGMQLYSEQFDCYHGDHIDYSVWAVRVPMPSVPVASVRVWDEAGNLVLDHDLDG